MNHLNENNFEIFVFNFQFGTDFCLIEKCSFFNNNQKYHYAEMITYIFCFVLTNYITNKRSMNLLFPFIIIFFIRKIIIAQKAFL